MTDSPDVAVLGLGRMGFAMARRYADSGWTVTSWSRSGGGSVAQVAEAVSDGRPVVLALFDGPACGDVLTAISATLAPGQLVVNTSTVGPDEAAACAALVAPARARYVQAPVLGSVPAVLAGSLRVLAGGTPDDVAAARTVLGAIAGDVRHVGDAPAAAAAKLVANASLAGSALALRDALEGAAGLGLPLSDALDVLELGRLGELVRGARDRLESGSFDDAFFTAGAIAKDTALLARSSGSDRVAERLRDLLAGEVREDDDFTSLALPAAYRAARVAR